jgi:protein ImuB
VGERRAGIAKLLDTYRPNAFRMERFVSQQEPVNGEGSSPTLSDADDIPPIALRILRPARQLRVQLKEGRPCKLAWLERNGDREDLQGRILWSAGPWRSSGDWWAERATAKIGVEEAQAWDREEWDIALANSDGNSIALYRIYHDAGTGQWFADASYD